MIHLFQGLCRIFQINKTLATPYHPRSNGMVERLNRTIKEMLSKYITSHQTDWDRYIDCIVLAYNTTPHETTGISPYRMLFAREANLSLNLMTEKDAKDSDHEIYNTEYVRNLEIKLKRNLSISKRNVKK